MVLIEVCRSGVLNSDDIADHQRNPVRIDCRPGQGSEWCTEEPADMVRGDEEKNLKTDGGL